MVVTFPMIGPNVMKYLASTVSENAGKQHFFVIVAKDTETSDITILQCVKNNLTIVQCPGKDSAEIRTLLSLQSY